MTSRYKQLSAEERRKIEQWRHAKVSVNDMVRVLNRHRSTIFRELRRNHFQDLALPGVVGYFGMAAQSETDRLRSKQRKLILYPDLCNVVVSRIQKGWTPKEIAERLRRENASPRICQETIYRHVYSKEGMSQELWWYLKHVTRAGP